MEKRIGIGREIVVMLVAFTMLFSVSMFSGCTNDNTELLRDIAQLRELLEEKSGLSQQLQNLTDLVNGMKESNDGLAGKIEALQGSIDGLAKRLSDLETSNADLLDMIGDLQEQVEKFQEKLREWERLQADFILTISVENTTLPHGEDFRVRVELKNNSGEDLTILHDVLFWLYVPNGWCRPSSIRHSVYFEANSTIQEGINFGTSTFGITLEQGKHVVIFDAIFNAQNEWLRVLSNSIVLTIT